MSISLLFLLIVLTFEVIHAVDHAIESTTSSGSNEKLSAASQPSASPLASQTASSSAEFSSPSSSQTPALSPSAHPHPPGFEAAPSEQKVSAQSVEKEKVEENGVGGLPKDSGKLGGSSSAESSGNSVADQSTPSSPTANGVNGQYSGWIGSSLLTMITIGALIA